MIKILVPISQFSGMALAAAYFALEFAKRNPAKIMFLIFTADPQPGARKASGGTKSQAWQAKFNDLVHKGRTDKVPLELHYSSDPFLPAVVHFAREKMVSDIIVALPPPQDESHARVVKMVNRLRHQIDCQIITVKPKEEFRDV